MYGSSLPEAGQRRSKDDAYDQAGGGEEGAVDEGGEDEDGEGGQSTYERKQEVWILRLNRCTCRDAKKSKNKPVPRAIY